MDEYAGIDAERLIPAYAGSTEETRKAIMQAQAHPRLRGEHRNGFRIGVGHTGSSPLTRGALGGVGVRD